MKTGKYVRKIGSDKFPLWKNKRPLLTRLDIELTERCNNNCIHCYINLPADDHTARNRELSTSQIKDILIEAASLGCLTIRFTGGEPFLREDFEKLYVFARKLGLKVLVFTNATLMTPHLAELFARIPPLENIEISFYGTKKESYEAVTRTPGSFKAARRGIYLLLEKKVPFVVKNTLLPPNKEEVDKFEAWASTISGMDEPASHSIFLDLRCRRDSEEKNFLIKRLRLSPDDGLKALTRNKEEYINEMKRFCASFTKLPGDLLFSCGAGKGGGCVDAYGRFQLCMMSRHPATVYDLKNGFLKDAMIHFFPEVRKMKAVNHSYLTHCARCFLKGLCEQCPAKSWMEHGTLDTPVAYHCEIAHAQARYLGLLEQGENAWEITNWEKRVSEFSGKKSKKSNKSCPSESI